MTDAAAPAPRYGLALIGIMATVGLSAVSSGGSLVRLLGIVVEGVVLIFVLMISDASPRTIRIAQVTVGLAIVAGIGSAVVGGDRGAISAEVVSVLLVIATPVAIIRRLLRHGSIDTSVAAGALCVYLLIGLFFAQLYWIVDHALAAPYFVQVEQATQADTTYYSFVTLATVGYGDLTAASDGGRMLSVLEALIGQLYLVTVVSLVVARLGAARSRGADGR